MKRNRPMIGKSKTIRYNVSLPPEIAERIRKRGKGNLSEGIRKSDELCREVKVIK